MSMFERLHFLTTLTELVNEPAQILHRRESFFHDFMDFCGADSLWYLRPAETLGDFRLSWSGGSASIRERPVALNSDTLSIADVVQGAIPIVYDETTYRGRWSVFEDCAGTNQIHDLVSIPLNVDSRLTGIFFVRSVPDWMYRENELDLMNTVAQMVAGCMMKASRLMNWQEQLRTHASITRLYSVLHETMSEQLLVEAFCHELTERFDIEAVLIQESASLSGKARLVYHWGNLSEKLRHAVKIETGSEREVAELLERLPDSIRDRLMSVPLFTRDSTFGLLIVQFSPDFLSSGTIASQIFRGAIQELASHMAIGLEHCRLYQTSRRLSEENQVRLWKFSLIYELSYLFRETMSREQRLHLILTAITLGDGMGFNRAILFLVDPKRNILEGTIGVGPSSGEEAEKVWRSLHRNGQPYRDWISTLMQTKSYEDSRFHQQVRSLSLPIVPESGILALTVLEKRAYHVQLNDGLPRCPKDVQAIFGAEEFAAAPLMSGEKVMGVIAVDNFYNRRPIRDDDVKMLGLFANQAGVSLEISMLHERLKELTTELENQHQQLEKREKLSALGELATAVVHEIRNPLVAIGGFARRLFAQQGAVSKKNDQKYLQIIIKEVDRLEKILHNISQFGRETSEPLSPIDLNAVLDDIIFLFESELEHYHIDLDKKFGPSLPKILGDESGLRQIFINLITNAIQAMKHGGSLTLSSSFDSDEGRFVSVAVTDSGGGIDPETLSNIFNPFFTTKEEGVGLGLTLTHKIVEHHNGAIRIVNHKGEGATFIVSFPACPE